MQHRYGDNRCDIKPDGHVQMPFSSPDDGHKEIDPENNPNDGDKNINRPFQFGIFLSGGKTKKQRNGCERDYQLPSPEMKLAQEVAEHTRFQQALQGIIYSHKHGVTDKSKNDGVGMQWTDPAKTCVRPCIKCIVCKLQSRQQAGQHPHNSKNKSCNGKVPHDAVVVAEFFYVHKSSCENCSGFPSGS